MIWRLKMTYSPCGKHREISSTHEIIYKVNSTKNKDMLKYVY